jgi:hypothetical protein
VRASQRGNIDAKTFLQQFTSSPQYLWLPYGDPSFQFWTENHTFILLTTAAYTLPSDPPDSNSTDTDSTETKATKPKVTNTATLSTVIALLRNWLNGHCFLDPTTQQNHYFIFELNSPPYTSHTVECLFLLVDYPIDGAPDLQGLAQNILLEVIKQIMSVSLCNKSWLSAAVRMYPQNRLPQTTKYETTTAGIVITIAEPLIFHTEIFDWINNTGSPLSSDQDPDNWTTGSPLQSSYLAYALAHTTYTLDKTVLPQPGQVVSLFGSPDPGHVNFTNMTFNW